MYTLIPNGLGWVRLLFNLREMASEAAVARNWSVCTFMHTELDFLPDSRLSYPSASRSVTYQPERVHEATSTSLADYFYTTKGNCSCRSLSKIIPSRAKQDTSTSRRGPVCPVGANDRHSVHSPLHNSTLSLSPTVLAEHSHPNTCCLQRRRG